MDKRHCPNEDITWPVVADAMAKEIQHRYKTWPALLKVCERYVRMQDEINQEMGKKPTNTMYRPMKAAIAQAKKLEK